MKSNTAKVMTSKPHGLYAIKGQQRQQTELDKLADNAWNFAYSSLWGTTILSVKESDGARTQIKEFFTLSKNPRKAFLEFCQRVLLARQYVMQGSNRYVPLPTIWLDKENAYGFAGTKKWLAEIKQVRESLPKYKQEIKALAEAVLEFGEEPTVQNYQYWREYFIDKNTPGLLSLFQTTAIQQLYQQGSKSIPLRA